MTVNTPEDEDFITVLYSKYEKMMFRIAYNILRNDTDAEDAVHDAFYNIIIRDGYSKLKRLKDTEIKAYLIVTVKMRLNVFMINGVINRRKILMIFILLRETRPPKKLCYHDIRRRSC